MSNNLKFEFEFDEVFEGIKQGVIRELSETNFEEAKSSAINQLKSEIKHKIYLTYSDENELKNEIKKEIKDKVFEKLLSEAKTEYKKYYEDLFNKNIVSEFNKTEKEVEADIKTKTINRLYNDLYSDIQTEMNDKIQIVIKKLIIYHKKYLKVFYYFLFMMEHFFIKDIIDKNLFNNTPEVIYDNIFNYYHNKENIIEFHKIK